MLVDTCNKFLFKLNCLQQLEYIKLLSRLDQIVSESNHGHYKLKMKMAYVSHTIYNPVVHTDRVEDRYIGATVKYFDIPLSLALNYLYYSLLIDGVDSRVSSLTYFQIYSLDEVIEMPISSDGSYFVLTSNNQNLSISIDIQLLSNRRCKKPRNPVLSVIDSILLEAWIFSYFSPKNSF